MKSQALALILLIPETEFKWHVDPSESRVTAGDDSHTRVLMSFVQHDASFFVLLAVHQQDIFSNYYSNYHCGIISSPKKL